MARIRSARPGQLHDGGNAGSRSQPVSRLRIYEGRRHAGTDAAADGDGPVAPRQQSEYPDLHRGLAAEGRRPVRTGTIALADLTPAPILGLALLALRAGEMIQTQMSFAAVRSPP